MKISSKNLSRPELFSTEAISVNDNTVSFCAGAVNWTMPTTWPFVITGVDLSTLAGQLKPVSDFLQVIMDVASTVTSPLYAVLHPLLATFDSILEATHLAYVPNMATLLEMLTQFSGMANNPGVKLKMNSFIGLANVGTQIQLGNTEMDIWGGIVAGPPYPIVMPRSGQVTSFEADLDALAVVNPQQLINIIPGFSELITALESILGVVATALDGLSVLLKPVLSLLLAPLGLVGVPTLPSFDTDFSKAGFAPGDTIEIVATLWRVPSILNENPDHVNMDPSTGAFIGAPVEDQGVQGTSSAGAAAIAQINLGEIELAHVAAWDATTSLPGTALTALAQVLGLNGAATEHDASESGQFASALVELPVPVEVAQGDSLMVEFEIVSPAGIDLAVGIAAPNLSANITFI